jgi:transposase
MSYQTLFVGIDVSKYKHDIAIVNEQKQFVGRPFVIKDDLAGYQQLIGKLDELMRRYDTQRCYIGLESTGDYWKNIYYYLKQQPQPFIVTVINPVQTRAHAKTELRRASTDAVNARDIARFMAEKQPPASFDRAPMLDTIKDIDRQIYQLKKQQTMTINKLRIELTKVAPEIEKSMSHIQGKQILALLAECPTAELIAKSSFQQLATIRYGNNNWALSAPFIEKVKSLSQQSIAYKTGLGAGYAVQSLVRCMGQFQREIDWLKSQSVELYQTVSDKESLLATIPGISRATAILLEAYIGDVRRFPNVKKLVAYFGMNPTVCTSGKSKRSSYLQKKGNALVRQKLFMAVLCMIRREIDPIHSYYQRLVDAGKPKLVAIGAAMRKLLVIIYYMLSKNEPFKN